MRVKSGIRRSPVAGLGLRGLSIVELLVGIAIGLFVVAGATLVATGQLSDNRKLMQETQLQQDLRAAADLVARELRRSGFWGNAATVVNPTGMAAPAASPYRFPASSAGAGGRTEVLYSFSSVDAGHPENNAEDAAEQYGFAHDSSAGSIQMYVGASGWQDLTDVAVMKVTKFEVQIPAIPLLGVEVPCPKYCDATGDTACWPRLTVREATISIAAESRYDPDVKRTIETKVQLRNGTTMTGACPA